MKVESSAMRRLAYDARGLWVEYVSGELYLYREVPRDLFNQLISSESRGRYVNEYIRKRFPFDHVFLSQRKLSGIGRYDTSF